jgi:hypothetical protein
VKQERSSNTHQQKFYSRASLFIFAAGLLFGIAATLAWMHWRAISEAEAVKISRPIALQYCVDHLDPVVCKGLKLTLVHDGTPGPTDSLYFYGNWQVHFETSRFNSIDVALDRRGHLLQVGQGLRNLWE